MLRESPLRDLPEWFEEIWENLVDDCVPAHTGTHPRVLLVNQPQSREEKWYRVSTVLLLAFRRTATAILA